MRSVKKRTPARSAAALRSNRRSRCSPRRRLDRTDAAEGAIDMAASPSEGKRWSQRVTQTSDALDLERSVFAKQDPRSIARSLKRSAERSARRKSNPYRNAMSTLAFYLNRAGKPLPKARHSLREAVKDEL